MLFIPESRKRPITESLLYKQIIRFLHEERIEGYFDIVFISIADGIVETGSRGQVLGSSKTVNDLEAKTYNLKPNVKLPPKNFRSGRSWVSKKQIEQMADSIVEYLTAYSLRLKAKPKVVAYARGSYLEAVRLANQVLSSKHKVSRGLIHNTEYLIQEFFSDDELAQLKKKGIMWMKIGLRMSEAFTIFRQRIKGFTQNEHRQLKLPI